MATPKDAARYLAEENGVPIPLDERLPFTDYGNAERLVAWHMEDLLYNHQWKKWLAWDGRRWSLNNDDEVMRRAKATAREIYRQASELATAATAEQDDTNRKNIADTAAAMLKWAKQSESRKLLESMIALAQSQSGIPIHAQDLDANHWVLNCPNGTIDLHTGDLADHRRADRLTKITATAYDPTAQCPRWLSFLATILDGKQEMMSFLQRAIGYSLTGSVSEHILFVLWGTGRNGKSTFLNTIMALMGDYADKAPKDLLMTKDHQVHETETTILHGARFVPVIETTEGRRINEVQVKELTGGDPITARRMREDFWTFWPTHKLWLATNHKPIVHGSDTGIWSRIRLIPFTVTIPVEDRDKHLAETLEQEWPGILAWAVRGCLEWQENGLQEPPAVWQATREYRAQMDVLGDFLKDRCDVNDEVKSTAKDLHLAFQAWAKETGEKGLTKHDFGQRLEERGFTPRRGAKGKRLWVGVGLQSENGHHPVDIPVQGEFGDGKG